MRSFKTKVYKLINYAMLTLQFAGTCIAMGTPIIALFMRKVLIINNLKVNLLLGINFIGLKKFNIIIFKDYANITFYNICIFTQFKARKCVHKARVFAAQYAIIAFYIF